MTPRPRPRPLARRKRGRCQHITTRGASLVLWANDWPPDAARPIRYRVCTACRERIK